jgi:hypothetical protein
VLDADAFPAVHRHHWHGCRAHRLVHDYHAWRRHGCCCCASRCATRSALEACACRQAD